MQDLLINIILGILQGLTEYLPVSSSGHIELGKALFGYKPNDSLTLSVILHFATVLSTVIVMRADIIRIFSGLLSFKWNKETKFAVNVVISMIPAALAGFLFEEQLEAFFEGNVLLVGFMLYITGLLLFLANKAKTTEKTINPKNAFIVGIAQAIALLPGISRSGATISSSVLLNIDKEEAAKFSFLMVIPLILGKVAKDLLDGDSLKFNGPDAIPMLAGFMAALLVGILACKWMLNIVKKGKLVYFSIYCFIVGTIAIVASLAAG